MKQPQNAKNLLVIYTHEECDSPKERVELYDVDTIDYIMVDGRSYLRVCCDGRFYYFKTQLTAIHSFVNYQRG